MVRIHNPVKGNKKKLGADQQRHGGMLEETDQISNAITKIFSNDGESKKNDAFM